MAETVSSEIFFGFDPKRQRACEEILLVYFLCALNELLFAVLPEDLRRKQLCVLLLCINEYKNGIAVGNGGFPYAEQQVLNLIFCTLVRCWLENKTNGGKTNL